MKPILSCFSHLTASVLTCLTIVTSTSASSTSLLWTDVESVGDTIIGVEYVPEGTEYREKLIEWITDGITTTSTVWQIGIPVTKRDAQFLPTVVTKTTYVATTSMILREDMVTAAVCAQKFTA
ncbi:hypothetical protein BDV97DRAFT_389877 [Delphinella strobiligena]|nr:hypothetical protein BDV97DRAFT_389877 [Delphinella strobiligena]